MRGDASFGLLTRTPALALAAVVMALVHLLAMPIAPAVAVAGVAASAPGDRRPPGSPGRSRAPRELASSVTRLSVNVGGLERRWVLVAPPAATTPVDLVIALHGVGNDGGQMRLLGLENLAIPSGVAIAFPDAAFGAWNDGRPGADVLSPDGRGADDIAFLRAVIMRSGALMQRTVRSVGVIGFSNGAMMAARAACEMSDIVSVVAIVAGSAPEGFQGVCRPQEPVSVAVVAARGDPVVPYGGGQVAPFQGRPRGRVSGVDATIAFWALVDACRATQTATAPAVPAVGVSEAESCQATRRVARFATDDASHDWRRAGGFDTTSVVWSFVHAQLPRIASDDDAIRAGLAAQT